MGEWPLVTLGDFVRIKHGWPFKSEHFSNGHTGRPIVVSIGNFRYTGGFRFGETEIKEYDSEYPPEYALSPGDILLVMTCQTAGGEILGIPARIPTDGRLYLHNQRMGKVEVLRKDMVDDAFLYWLFLDPAFNSDLCLSASGTKILHTSPSRIENFRFRLPPLPEQNSIAQILGALDDKIELNRRMNKTLEATARALFKSWFVDFDQVNAKAAGRSTGLAKQAERLFPDSFSESNGGKTPNGWRVRLANEFAEVVYGAPFASAQFNSTGFGRPLVRIRDLADERPGVWTMEKHPKGYLVCPGDIVVGMDGEFRAYLWGGDSGWLNQRVCVFKAKEGFSPAFVWNSIMRPLKEVEDTETATTVIHLGKSDIDRFTAVVPGKAVLDLFNKACQPLLDRIVAARHESLTLSSLRDTLLPKLISGELRIKDAERFVAGG